MKKLSILIMLALVLSVLIACNAQMPAADITTNDQVPVQIQEQEQETAFQGEMPEQMQLMIGSLMLEETDLAINSDQAEELLPLWKLTKTLTSSGTAAQGEIDAVMTQIQETMTLEQLAYVSEAEMDLAFFQALMAELGIGPGASDGEGKSPEGAPGGGSGGGIPGQGQGGGRGGGLGGGIPGGNLSPEQQATREASTEERGGSFGFNNIFLDALIAMLEGKLE
jgi:hypothetical protein